MLWAEAVRKLSANLDEPFALEFVIRGKSDLTKLDWLNLQRTEISEPDLSELTKIATRLAAHEPPQYIVGWAEFCDLRFKVDSRVLIPRPETEELVQRVLMENDGASPLRVLDVGTGSGAIATALAKARSSWKVTATDISEVALKLAQENAIKNSVTVNFVTSDVLAALDKKYDLIVSNPPYISPDARDEVETSVQVYEPHLALFADHQGLAIYEKLAQQAPEHLTENGKLYLEIGYKQAAAVKELFEKAFPKKRVQVYQDSFGKDRMVSVR